MLVTSKMEAHNQLLLDLQSARVQECVAKL